MWSLFLLLRLLSSQPVLVLSDRKDLKASPIVVTYMSRENIPWKNWWDLKDWTIKGNCKEEGGTPFTKVYLWEGPRRWIQEGTWKIIWIFDETNNVWKKKPPHDDNKAVNWPEISFFDKLEACEDIVEFNIDGGPFNEGRIDAEEELMSNYAHELVGKLKKTTKKSMTITWYNNCVYGMDWSVGPYRDKSKFTWKKDMGKVLREEEDEVKQLTYPEFWKLLISETCTEIIEVGECYGILLAYSDSPLISCKTVGVGVFETCESSYYEYTRKSGPSDDVTRIVDHIEPLVNYLQGLKKLRQDIKGEL